MTDVEFAILYYSQHPAPNGLISNYSDPHQSLDSIDGKSLPDVLAKTSNKGWRIVHVDDYRQNGIMIRSYNSNMSDVEVWLQRYKGV